jgi:membrane protein DedA with SNARE-associated domain
MSMELVSLETIQQVAHDYGYWSVFFGIMLENAGLPIPGETITLVGGFLAGSAIAGAVIGDNFGYWLGYYGGWSLLMRLGKLFRISEAQLLEAKEQFSKNADKAVFLGRFIALLRIFAGPMAGIARMPYPRFIACNLAGAAVWAVVTISAAYFAGAIVPIEVLMAWASRFTLLALAVVAAGLAGAYVMENRTKVMTWFKFRFGKPLKQED